MEKRNDYETWMQIAKVSIHAVSILSYVNDVVFIFSAFICGIWMPEDITKDYGDFG